MKERAGIDPRDQLLKEKKPIGIEALKERLGLTDRDLRAMVTELVEEGYGAGIQGGTFFRTTGKLQADVHDFTKQFPSRNVRFGLIADTHLSSKRHDPEALEKMYDTFEKEGIKHVFHCGDLSEGQNVFRGQELEVLHFGQEEQIEHAIKAYPKRRGVKTYWIGGNHDLKMYEKGGVDPGPQIERARPDMPYLGQYSTRIQFKDGVTMDMLHPNGSPAYALSYKLQRFINNMPANQRPDIYALGHWHAQNWCRYQGIHGLLVPAFKSPGSFEKRLGFGSDIGGYIVDATIDSGKVARFRPELFTFGQRGEISVRRKA